MILNNNPYHNFYDVNGKIYTTKLFAKIAAKNDDDDILWRLPNFEKEFDKLDLSVEPEESLDYFYLKRCEQLRNEYDHLVLHYSGGHDSHNILETFMFNNIFLDEILITDPYDKTFLEDLESKNFPFLHLDAYEPKLSAIPLAQHFINTYSPKTRLTVAQNSFKIHSDYWSSMTEKNMIDNLRLPGTLGMTGKSLVRLHDLNLYDTSLRKIKENKRVAHIWGRDKVILTSDDFGYYFNFIDGNFVDWINSNNSLSKDQLMQNTEFFYSHPSQAKMILKQAHVIMNKLPSEQIHVKLITRSREDAIARLIYNRKIHSSYQGLKAGDFENWTMHLSSKEYDPSLSLYNMTDLSLYKTLKLESSLKFDLQSRIISDFTKCGLENVTGYMGKFYSTKKFYIKHF